MLFQDRTEQNRTEYMSVYKVKYADYKYKEMYYSNPGRLCFRCCSRHTGSGGLHSGLLSKAYTSKPFITSIHIWCIGACWLISQGEAEGKNHFVECLKALFLCKKKKKKKKNF